MNSAVTFLNYSHCSWDEVSKLLIACLLGGILGLERELTRHPAGLRTHILISLCAASVMLLGFYLLRTLDGTVKFDPGRTIQGIITGMGFIGAGAIMKEGYSIHGITTAASLWVACAVGMMTGAGAIGMAVFTTLLATATMALSPRLKHPEPDHKPNTPADK